MWKLKTPHCSKELNRWLLLGLIILFIIYVNMISNNNAFLSKSCNSLSPHKTDKKNQFIVPADQFSSFVLSSVQYRMHERILISSNADFINQSIEERWFGNGSENNPIIISSLVIDGEGKLLHICNVSLHFQIINCLLINGDQGISFENVTNGEILYNLIQNNRKYGISLVSSFKNRLVENRVLNNSEVGIRVINSSEIVLSNNTMNNHQNGIFFNSSGSNNLLIENIIHENMIGVNFISSNNTVITKNLIYNNFGEGVVLNNSISINITENYISHNRNQGIFLYFSDACNISDNVVDFNDRGIFLVVSYSNWIIRNRINNNSAYGVYIRLSRYNRLNLNQIDQNNMTGCLLNGSIFSIISNNSISDNMRYGIDISFSCHNNIFHNRITQNHIYGIVLGSSSNNTIEMNNFFRNSQIGNSQAEDHDNDLLRNNFTRNYWHDSKGSDVDLNGVIDIPYLINGTSDNSDQLPVASPYQLEISLVLSKPVVINPFEGKIIEGNVTISWYPVNYNYDQNITYTIFYSANEGHSWQLLVANLANTSYTWDTKTTDDGSKYLIKVIANDSEGLIATTISSKSFEIRNAPSPYSGITLIKLLIVLDIFLLFSLLITVSINPLKKIIYWYKEGKKNSRILDEPTLIGLKSSITQMKWLILAIFLATILSVIRAWLIDPPIIVDDGYQNYARRIEAFFFDWSYAIDLYIKSPHQLRITYSILIAIVELIFPFLNIIFVGRIITFVSFLLCVYELSKILDYFESFSQWENKERILILFIMCPTIITNLVRLETDIIFLAISLYVIQNYMNYTKNDTNLRQKINLIFAIGLMLFTREVGFVLFFVLFLHYIIYLNRKLKLVISLFFIGTIIIGFVFNILQDIIWYTLWTSTTHKLATRIFEEGDFSVLLDIILGKLRPATFIKNSESLFYAFIPGALFGFLGFIRLYRTVNKEDRKKIIFNIITMYFFLYFVLYIILKVGGGLDRFWIPILSFPLFFLPFTIDLDVFKNDFSIFLKALIFPIEKKIMRIRKNGNTRTNNLNSNAAVLFHFSSMMRNLVTLENESKSIVPKASFYFILVSQLSIYIFRLVLSLITSGILPVYP